MIKSLFDTDEEPSPKIEPITEKTSFNPPVNKEMSAKPEIENAARTSQAAAIFEIPEDTQFFAKPPENQSETEQNQPIPETEAQIEISPIETKADSPIGESPPLVEENRDELPIAEPKKVETSNMRDNEPTIFQSDYSPESTGETIHNSGLAYSAAIVLFASIVFMMILGWFIGQLIGNSTGGIVGGIILGAVIGFVQFFRITSSIFKK